MPKQSTKSKRRGTTTAGAIPKLTVRAQQLQSTRAGILQSALIHFSRHGYEGASLRDIAADADVNHGMIRHIYGSKEEVWRAAITFLFDRLDREVNLDDEIQAGRSDRELFTTYVHRYVSYCARHPEHARIMIQQSGREGPTLDWAVRRFIRARHRVAGPMVQRDIDSSSIFFQKLDTTKVGAVGHSQGAGGTVNATNHSSGLIKTAVTIALPNQIWVSSGDEYYVDQLTVPVLFLGGATDTIIASPATQTGYYNQVPGAAAVAVLKGAGHNTIQQTGGGFLGYINAWLMYVLRNDTAARGAFVGATPEINTNTSWQNQAEKNLP